MTPEKEIEQLKGLIDLKENERREWANTCINKQREIERMKSSLNKIRDLAEDGASLTLIYNEAELALEK